MADSHRCTSAATLSGSDSRRGAKAWIGSHIEQWSAHNDSRVVDQANQVSIADRGTHILCSPMSGQAMICIPCGSDFSGCGTSNDGYVTKQAPHFVCQNTQIVLAGARDDHL